MAGSDLFGRECRYYVSGEAPGGSAFFGFPVPGEEEARAICERQHTAGYRKLRVYDYRQECVLRYIKGRGLVPTNPDEWPWQHSREREETYPQ